MATQAPDIWTVSQLTRRVKHLLEGEVGRVWVAGEISNWRASPAGHAYFTLKDEGSQLDGVMFRGRLQRLRFRPESGIEVAVFGQITVYERRGNYQIICEKIQPKGLGALQLAFEKLKKKLAAEGLFDQAHKQPLPMLPRRIGIVTSPTGAAIRDMLNVINRRFAHVHVVLYPARVQGAEAAREIVAAIRALDTYGVDVMIVGRGGGSLEDLWPFNEEAVVRAVFDTPTPIISAVGHEIDYALTDFAADVRAPTPSAAAEIVVQEHEALVERIATLRRRLGRGLGATLDRVRHRVAAALRSPVFRRPDIILRERRQTCDDLRMRLEQLTAQHIAVRRNHLEKTKRGLALLSPTNQVRRSRERLADLRRRNLRIGAAVVERARARLTPLRTHLDALSPVAILARGYAIAFKQDTGELVRDVRQLAPGNTLEVRLGRGSASASVTHLKDENHGSA
ncbi:MAG: exodeoxyribonuclease VII large subunit [Candidatus Hydrogenedentota bacterium]